MIDTALGMMLRDSCTVLLESAGKLMDAIAKLEIEHRDVPMMVERMGSTPSLLHSATKQLRGERNSTVTSNG